MFAALKSVRRWYSLKIKSQGCNSSKNVWNFFFFQWFQLDLLNLRRLLVSGRWFAESSEAESGIWKFQVGIYFLAPGNIKTCQNCHGTVTPTIITRKETPKGDIGQIWDGGSKMRTSPTWLSLILRFDWSGSDLLSSMVGFAVSRLPDEWNS